ncbi:MAG: RnfABCDGE type electron transport complex subunit G [Clostridia bacterium]|nr:RnfABCDGE type electron transport complex subunit G [Clostridia bacterium]
MKEITSLTIKLFLFCTVVAALLATVNGITQPIIAENEAKNFQLSMQEVLSDASSFEKMDIAISPAEGGVTVSSVHRADTGGFVVSSVCSEGYGGDVTIMVGINPDLTVKQVRIMSMSETPGLGAKASSSQFTDQYRGLKNGIEVIKNATPSGNQIQALSGATVTSRAVTKAVNAALLAAEQAQGGIVE